MKTKHNDIPQDIPQPHADILDLSIRAARDAGSVLMDLYSQPHDIHYKGDIDLVTEADVASEQAVKAMIQAESNVEIMAEESTGRISYPHGPVWIIDPLDGTTNYAHGFPFFCISICYYIGGTSTTEEQQGPLTGVVYCPVLNELFTAVRGYGAWLNGTSISTTKEKKIARALMATGFPYNIRNESSRVMDALQSIIVRAQGIRRAGAAALDLAWLACGRVDGFWEAGLKPWDTAAGQLLVTEAGGMVTDFKGDAYNPFIKEILASNAHLHHELVRLLNKF